jgi:hypothetical protein
MSNLSTQLTHHAQVSGLNRVAIYSFFSGIILLGIFVAHNLLATIAACCEEALRLFELARVLMRFNHVASLIINANHSIG